MYVPTYPDGWRGQRELVAGTRSYLIEQGNHKAFGSPDRENKKTLLLNKKLNDTLKKISHCFKIQKCNRKPLDCCGIRENIKWFKKADFKWQKRQNHLQLNEAIHITICTRKENKENFKWLVQVNQILNITLKIRTARKWEQLLIKTECLLYSSLHFR